MNTNTICLEERTTASSRSSEHTTKTRSGTATSILTFFGTWVIISKGASWIVVKSFVFVKRCLRGIPSRFPCRGKTSLTSSMLVVTASLKTLLISTIVRETVVIVGGGGGGVVRRKRNVSVLMSTEWWTRTSLTSLACTVVCCTLAWWTQDFTCRLNSSKRCFGKFLWCLFVLVWMK